MIKKIIICSTLLFIFIGPYQLKANPEDAQIWLNTEISKIINLYRDKDTDIIERLNAVENAINNSFAGTGIARFVVGKKVWEQSSKSSREKFVTVFKEHLYLTIGSLMQGYSNQDYKFLKSREDKNGVYLIDMEIINNEQKTLVTWRVKESKGKYYIIDLLVADISLVVTKRSEFNSLLGKVDNNLNNLNSLLKKQNKESYSRLIK